MQFLIGGNFHLSEFALLVVPYLNLSVDFLVLFLKPLLHLLETRSVSQELS